ncbi:uncharacterized protein AMSG_00361 [Thecamonas trahens ATCC 50062]|uniref:Palmitoyltransferase n=1 Tax=Thecamonas trahens ATCC 50062 TaxID=461836 RepID=A0A0L0D8D2_THETB|nr:hypothetical protein AMSG_00361 [Thecamonas trahens ATCC 50062]KNC48584.1 hypothetical protein AMSG_00361 [Thecamonas trahens ATCC 50062]|eukprot:XP_013762640.1 hypothetical protein AMSG_00361 [Thecamonas trahens ATCC 50062]
MCGRRSWQRRHGFERPFSLPQLAAWVLKVVLGGLFIAFLLPAMPVAVAWIIGVAVSIALVLALSLMLLLTGTNPGHPLLAESRPWELPEPEPDYSQPAINPDTLFCRLCQITTSPRTKHCWTCGKCVAGFDHHCMWLNTCVGDRNYAWFFAYLVTMTGLAVTLMGTSFVVFVVYFVDQASVDSHFYNVYPESVPLAVVAIVSGTVGVLCAIALALLAHLLAFHIFLIYKGESTYDYIVRQRAAADAEADAAGEDRPLPSTSVILPQLLATETTGSPLSARRRRGSASMPPSPRLAKPKAGSNKVAPLSLVSGKASLSVDSEDNSRMISPREMAAERVAQFAARYSDRSPRGRSESYGNSATNSIANKRAMFHFSSDIDGETSAEPASTVTTSHADGVHPSSPVYTSSVLSSHASETTSGS